MQQTGNNTGTQQRGVTTVTAREAVSATEAQPRGNKEALEEPLPTPISQQPTFLQPLANTRGGGGGGGGGERWRSSKPPPSASSKAAVVLAAPAAASFEAKARALFEAKAKARAHSKNSSSSSAKSGYGISSIDISSIDASTGTGYKDRHSGELMGVGVSVQEHKAYSGESLATVATGSKALESCGVLLARGEG
jgi:hypothetical protein